MKLVSNPETLRILPSPIQPQTLPYSQELKYSCDICMISFIFERDLQYHLSVSTPHNPKTFKCLDCDLLFSSFRGMKQHHGKIHEKKKHIPCQLCSKLFKDKYALKFHRLHVHENSKRVRCEKCSFLCYTKYVYREHIKKCSQLE